MMTNRISAGLTLAALGTAGLVGSARAQEDTTPLLERGTQELAISGRLDLPDLDELDYDIDGSYGYFFRDGWEAGVTVTAADFGGRDRIEIAGFTEYNFRRNSDLVPFVGGSIGLVSADFDDQLVLGTPIDDDSGLIFDVSGGVKFFIRRYMAISASVDFKFSTDDVFATDEAIEDSLTSIKLGMRYYF